MDMRRSEVTPEDQARYLRRGDYARITAADRPGVAQPVPLREVPAQPWGRILLGACVLFALLLGAWEWHWRAFGVQPAYHNDSGLWAIQRRRIDNGEGNATVLVGSSRMFFDLQLDVWQRLDGERPIQLSFEGTTSLPFLEDLANDPKFTGRLLVGVAPQLFFSGDGFHKGAIEYYHKESPSQHVSQWLSMHLIEPFWAFDDDDYALDAVLRRQDWPLRPGLKRRLPVRRLSVSAEDRATHLWDKVASDPAYRQIARETWLNHLDPADDPPPDKLAKTRDEQIDRAAKAVAALRARGVKVLFVRPPSVGPYLAFDDRLFPRAQAWDVLLAKSGAQGIYFSDYPELSGFDPPEWSHLELSDAQKFTAALHAIIVRDYWKPNAPK